MILICSYADTKQLCRFWIPLIPRVICAPLNEELLYVERIIQPTHVIKKAVRVKPGESILREP